MAREALNWKVGSIVAYMLYGTFMGSNAFGELSGWSTGARVIIETREIVDYTEVLRNEVTEIESS